MKNTVMSRPYPQNVIADWMKIQDEDLELANVVTVDIMIREVCNNLRDKKVVEYRYRDGMTYAQIAEKIEVSPSRVQQMILRMQEKARHPSLVKLIFTGKEIWKKYRR